MNTIILTASGVSVSELKSSRRYMTVSMRMFSTRENRNGCAVTEAFIDDIIANKNDYVCMPLCADVPKLKKKDYRGLTHMYDKTTRTFLADRVGGFYDFEKVEDEYGVSLIGYARIDKRNDLICEAIEELYANDALHFSFEISAGSLMEVNGVKVVDAHPDNELTAMAIVSVPAYPESTALDLVAEAQTNSDGLFSTANFILSEMDLETVKSRFHMAIHALLGERAYDFRVLLFGTDFVILYDYVGGVTYKAEYFIDVDAFVLTDFYSVDYVRSEGSKDMDNQMNMAEVTEVDTVEVKAEEMAEEVVQAESESEVTAEGVVAEEVAEATEQIEAETAESAQTEEVVAEEGEPEEELDNEPEEKPEEEAKKDELAEALNENASLKAKIEELEAIKAELDAIREREAQEKLNSKKASLKEYASSEGLDVENEIIAEAIDTLNYEALVAEVTNKKNSEKKAEQSVSVFATFDINAKGKDYLYARSGK